MHVHSHYTLLGGTAVVRRYLPQADYPPSSRVVQKGKVMTFLTREFVRLSLSIHWNILPERPEIRKFLPGSDENLTSSD